MGMDLGTGSVGGGTVVCIVDRLADERSASGPPRRRALSVFAIRAAAAIAPGVRGMLFSFQWGGANHNRARRSAGAKPGVADRRASNRISKLRREDDLRLMGRWVH